MSEVLHMHSGTGYFVTSLSGLLVLNSGCPKESRWSSFTILLNSVSGRDVLRKYGNMCLLLGVISFLCPA